MSATLSFIADKKTILFTMILLSFLFCLQSRRMFWQREVRVLRNENLGQAAIGGSFQDTSEAEHNKINAQDLIKLDGRGPHKSAATPHSILKGPKQQNETI
jgi:hypothetical protein